MICLQPPRPATGVSRALRPEVSRECPRGCPGHPLDSPGTLSKHFLDTPEPGAKGPGNTPSDTPSDTPVFRDTVGDTLGTLRARRARETPVAGRGGCNDLLFCQEDNMDQGGAEALQPCEPPGLLQESLRPSGPKCPGSVPRGVFGALRALRSGVSKKCPKSVPKVSPECQTRCPDTPGTLLGHFLDTPDPRPKGPQRHPKGHSRHSLGPKGPRNSCSRPGGSATPASTGTKIY